MTAAVWRWPALDLAGQAPQRLEVEWAVWGKVHGAASDFRWIAHSPGIDPLSRRLELELVLGTEDAPQRATFWRALEERFCAVSCYPSRAWDAARRSGFLEKQVLEWTCPAGAPAALGALLLLPRVAAYTDETWWDQSTDARWSRPEFSLVLEPEEASPVAVAAGDLQHKAETGLAAVREAVGDESSLAELYSALLTDRRPAILSGLRRPLPPEGIAALLLPLPRRLADRLSVAGWTLSRGVNAESFRRLWDVLICDRPPAELRSSSPVAVTEEGRAAAWAVFHSDPSRLGGRPPARIGGARMGTPQPPSAIERLKDFATDETRRWLPPEELGRPLRTAEGRDGDLAECAEVLDADVRRLDGESGALGWRRRHLEVKADLLRAAALALAPATFRRLGLPRSGRVPALLYYPFLAEQGWGGLGELGQDSVLKIVRQSLGCRPDLFGRRIDEWLHQWGRRQGAMTWLAPALLRRSQ